MRLPLIFVLLGTVVIAVATGSLVGFRSRSSSPGVLEATRGSLQWRCPGPSESAVPGAPRPTFDLVNVGDTPVRIASIETSCGCARAKAEPLLVPPRGRSLVTIDVDPLELGVRLATVTLNTDSHVTPVIHLQITEEGYRRPPYVFQFESETYYPAGYTINDSRDVRVDVIVLKDVPEVRPVVTSDLAFLRFDPIAVDEKPYILDPRMVVRSYRFSARFATAPPVQGFSGTVSVADPWAPDRVLRRNVFGEPNPALRAIPSRLVIEAGGDRPRARFQVRSSRGHGPLSVSIEEGSPLEAKPIGPTGPDKLDGFEVQLKPGMENAEGTFQVAVARGPDQAGGDSLVVPVLVRHRKGGAP